MSCRSERIFAGPSQGFCCILCPSLNPKTIECNAGHSHRQMRDDFNRTKFVSAILILDMFSSLTRNIQRLLSNNDSLSLQREKKSRLRRSDNPKRLLGQRSLTRSFLLLLSKFHRMKALGFCRILYVLMKVLLSLQGILRRILQPLVIHFAGLRSSSLA